LINLSINDYDPAYMFDLIMDNLDFLLRFYRLDSYHLQPLLSSE